MSEYILQALNIEKNFPGVKALDNVSFQLKPGEVHALLGENGAGKSTLMKILSGVYSPDKGQILYKDKPVVFHTPKNALDAGIATIYQELNLCKHLTVMNNIFLNREVCKVAGIFDAKIMFNEVKDILSMVGLGDIDPRMRVSDLPISKQQLVEIAKVLSMNSKIIIFDEPTSSLSSTEVDILFGLINDLKKRGIAMVYISHRLEELPRIADRYTVLMDGNFVTSNNYEGTTIDMLIRHMTGRQISEKFPRIDTPVGKTLFRVQNFTKEPYVRDISFELKEGEILGIGGLIGAGRSELAKAIFGYYGATQGEVFLGDKQLHIRSPQNAIAEGIVYVPEDRKKEGLAVQMEVIENMMFPSLKSFSNAAGILNMTDIKTQSQKMVSTLNIKTPSLYQRVKNLSGGNQQKIVVGKWLMTKPKIIIFDEPTRGIDVNAKVNMYSEIQELKKQGIGIIVISSEMPELFGISDRIMVLSLGRCTAQLETKKTTPEEVLLYATKK